MDPERPVTLRITPPVYVEGEVGDALLGGEVVGCIANVLRYGCLRPEGLRPQR